MSKEHSVIIVPGLRDAFNKSRQLTDSWRDHELKPIVHSVDWRNGGDEFIPRNTVALEGASNVDVPRFLHLSAINRALTFPKPVVIFLKGKE